MTTKFYRASDLVGTAKGRKRGQKGLLGTSPAWLWRRVQRNEFPTPLKLSEGVTVFRADEVDAWLATRARKAKAA